jgi:hypothetical protein
MNVSVLMASMTPRHAVLPEYLARYVGPNSCSRVRLNTPSATTSRSASSDSQLVIGSPKRSFAPVAAAAR